ncbi:MAG: hypothetical protein R3330_03655 [Saprospiraceae bacterium]|nr:hypothetical protein [Saprospiraceae bacterium]
MTKPALVLLCTIVFLPWSQGQETKPDISEYHTFALIYLTQKKFPGPDQDTMRALLIAHDVSVDRYGEIMRRRIDQDRVTLSPNEEALIQSIAQANHAHQNRESQMLRDLCDQQGMAYQRYLEMHQQFRSDIAFQRRLKPYFDEILSHDQ